MKRWFVALAFVLGSVPSPALAHSSDYCGHGTSGTATLTIYSSSFNVQHGHWTPHHHRYEHRTWGGLFFDHFVVKHCPKH